MHNDKKACSSTVEIRGDRGRALISFPWRDKLVRSFLKAIENVQQDLKFLCFLLDSRPKCIEPMWEEHGIGLVACESVGNTDLYTKGEGWRTKCKICG